MRVLKKIISKVCSLCAWLVASLLYFLIAGIRPLLGAATCRYQVGCTKFALYQLETEPLHKAVWLIIKRVLSCNPISSMFHRWHHRHS